MQQTLYIVRHAHASESEDDRDRPVSAKGRRQLQRLAQALAGKSLIAPSAVWHSDFRRSKETAELLARGLGLEVALKSVAGLRPFDDPLPTAEVVNQTEENLMIVGHEPSLSSLAAHLITETQTLQCVVFPKSSILCISRLTAGGQATPWQIEWHLHHRIFK